MSYSSVYDDSGIGGGAYEDNDSDVERTGRESISTNRRDHSSSVSAAGDGVGLVSGYNVGPLPPPPPPSATQQGAPSAGPGPTMGSIQPPHHNQQPQQLSYAQIPHGLHQPHIQHAPSYAPSHQQLQPQQQQQQQPMDPNKKPKKAKKIKEEHNYVCVTCGRTDSPEWRKVCALVL